MRFGVVESIWAEPGCLHQHDGDVIFKWSMAFVLWFAFGPTGNLAGKTKKALINERSG